MTATGENEDSTFYDVHCHFMDLSHPCIYPFIKRALKVSNFPLLSSITSALAGATLGLLAPFGAAPLGKKLLNYLSIMERNVGEMLSALEDDLPHTVAIGAKHFDRITVTPLMMDFWADDTAEHIYYQFTPKSIIPQVMDLLNGIADYANTLRGDEYEACIRDFPIAERWRRKISYTKQLRLDLRRITHDTPGKDQIIAHYGPAKRKIVAFPFMGLNTSYCYLDDTDRLPYESTNLRTLLLKYFDRHSPAPYTGTPHGLKSNFGHFGGKNAGMRYTEHRLNRPYRKLKYGGDPNWVKLIIELLNYDNVYTDISCSGVSSDYYRELSKIINTHEAIRSKLLFGSDFTVNLLWITNYRQYIENFLSTEFLDSELKIRMCNTNPRAFLYN